MIYLLKFGASFLMVPGIFIVLLFVIAFLLLRKNERRIASCLAGLAAVTAGRNPIKMRECLYMRRVYKKKYSKLISMRV